MQRGVALSGGFVRAVLLVGLVLFGVASLSAQTTSGTILGDVRDSSGAAVPNAEIVITNSDTGVVRSAASNADGVYNVPSLLPGRYSVEARAQGFNAAQVKDVVLRVGSEVQVNLALQVGSTTQSVTVTEAIPLVETTSAEVSQVMDETAIASIPLNARDIQQLASIQPAVQGFGGSGYGNRNMTVAGDRPVNNRFLQEGIDTTSVYHNSPSNLTHNVMLGVEAVKEFKVLTTDFGPEYGEQSGGVMNVLLKSGTNTLHGSGYEYYRNDAFDARNFFNQGSAPDLHRHQFGVSLGGPIRKDKTFFFVNYEGLRKDEGQTYLANVPDAAARGVGSAAGFAQVPCAGVTATTAGGCGPAPGTLATNTLVTVPLSTDVSSIFFGGTNPLYPVCNGASVGGGLCQYSSSPIENTAGDYYLVKIDHSFSSKNTLSSSYNMDRGWVLTPGPLNNTLNDRVDYRQTFTLQDTHIITSNLVNTVRAGVTRIWINDQKDMTGEDGKPGTDRYDPRLLPVHLLVPCAEACTAASPGFPSGAATPLPTIAISGGMTTFGGSARAANFDPRWFGYMPITVNDDVNWLKGKHAMQFGFQFKRIYDNLAQYRGNPTGAWSFSNLPQFLKGGPANTFGVDLVSTVTPQQAAAGVTASTYGRDWATNLYGIYGEDTYKFRPNLTLTYGLRWEYVPGPSERYGRMASIYNPTPVLSVTPALGSLYHGSKTNFAPRVGFNYVPFKGGKTSVRAGGGVFFNEIWDDTFFTGGTAQFPYVFSVTGLSNVMPFPFNQAILDAQVANPLVSGARQTFGGSIEQYPHTPTKYGYNLMIQQELPGHMSLLIGYIGAQQRHQGRSTSWQDYDPTTVEVPGQLPMVNGVAIPNSVINPNCIVAGQQACLYWAGVGVQNANVIGNGGTLATNPTKNYATLCTATQVSNCFNNNNYGSITDIIYDADSSYNGVTGALERRVTPGLFARFNYTFSKCMNDAIGDRGGGASNGGGNAWTPTTDHKGSRARCAFQGTQSANFSFTYDVPFGRMVSARFAKALLGGWQISSLTQVQSGFPFEVRLGVNGARASTSGNGNGRPDLAPNCTPQNAINKGNPNAYVNTSCFLVPAPGYLGNLGALILTGPSSRNTDVSLKKSLTVREGMNVQLSADMFNAFNHTNFSPPSSTTAFTNTGTNAAPVYTPNSTAGQITSTNTSSRQFQIGARFTF